MNTPVLNFGAYFVCFAAEEEDRSARDHFIRECGWTPSQFRPIKDFAWFCAHVSIVKDGETLADAYLGACSYRTAREFWTTYAGDYFADMVDECADQINDPDLTLMVSTWRQVLHARQQAHETTT